MITHPNAQPVVAANWKMNLNSAEVDSRARTIADGAPTLAGAVRLLVGPPHVYVERTVAALAGSSVEVFGQDLHWTDSGAFTGAVSGSMLVDAGATHVLVGHSERRQLFGDNDDDVRRKLEAALRAGLIPILCVGESLEEREAGNAVRVVRDQIRAAVDDSAPPGAGSAAG